MTNETLKAGDRVRFEAPLSNGGTARWTATVIRVQDGIAYVRHPQAARRIPFSPVKAEGIYKYHAAKLAGAVVK